MNKNQDNEKEDRSVRDHSGPGFPEPPDLSKVSELREQIDQERRNRSSSGGFFSKKLGRQPETKARDIGTYTLIPMLMLAGPAVGYALGLWAQNRWGGEPWGAVTGMLFGLVAGFRQVFLLLAQTGKPDGKTGKDNDLGEQDKNK